MIDFATLKGLTVPEGVVVKIESGGVVLWELQTGGTVVLEVEKITSNTYAGSTTYENEEFIALDIYPKSGGTVSLTYGGLTKTITDDGTSEEPNAQQVFFGTFNGVSDEVETPVSGTLTIDGGYVAFGVSKFNYESKNSKYCSCITSVIDFGSTEMIPERGFSECDNLSNLNIPDSITSIGNYAFEKCQSLSNVKLPSVITSIGEGTFISCHALQGIVIPDSVQTIGDFAFYLCGDLVSITIPSGVTSIGQSAFAAGLESITVLAQTPPSAGADLFASGTPTIYVPVGCAEAYKAADGWSTYADYIVEVAE